MPIISTPFSSSRLEIVSVIEYNCSMVEATALKTGKTFEIDGVPFQVVKFELQKIARGGGTVKLAVRNLETGALAHKTMNSSVRVQEINTVKRPLQYLYADGDTVSFMDPDTYDQIEIKQEIVNDQLLFIKEGQTVNVMFWDDKALSVDIAPKVTLTVKETTPGVKGNSATNVYKPATLENGLEVKVPLFIKVGEKIRVDTRSGEYIERAN